MGKPPQVLSQIFKHLRSTTLDSGKTSPFIWMPRHPDGHLHSSCSHLKRQEHLSACRALRQSWKENPTCSWYFWKTGFFYRFAICPPNETSHKKSKWFLSPLAPWRLPSPRTVATAPRQVPSTNKRNPQLNKWVWNEATQKKDIKTFSSWICWKGTHFNQTIFPPRLFYKKEKTLLKTPSVFCASLVQFPSKTHCECTLRGEGGTSWEFVPSELKTELPNARITGKPPFLAFGLWTGETNAIFDVFASESKRRSEETPTNPQVPVGHGYPLWTMLVSIYPFSKG